ncbi:hypothetical protein H9P43_007813 [Blastocladiella emersonii ATCC 22665]|nr:hypothetical protein H9P43_007813 [Blastocladiella emersonii ATCC 22665]
MDPLLPKHFPTASRFRRTLSHAAHRIAFLHPWCALGVLALVAFMALASLNVPMVADEAPSAAVLASAQAREPVPAARVFPAPCYEPGIDTLVVIPMTADLAKTRRVRAALQQTWASPAVLRSHHMCLAYIVGRANATARPPLRAPRLLGDGAHVEVDAADGYLELSEKMGAAYAAIAAHAPAGVQWIVKADGDTLVFPRALRRTLAGIAPRRALVGHKYASNRVMRTGAWANTVYPGDTYPTYMAGAGFAASRDVVEWVGKQYAGGWLRAMPNEDAMLGVWVAGAHVDQVARNDQFLPLLSKHGRKHATVPDTVCGDGKKQQRARELVLLHSLTPEAIEQGWARYAECGSPCACPAAGPAAIPAAPARVSDAASEERGR